jgi:hypothetical protein
VKKEMKNKHPALWTSLVCFVLLIQTEDWTALYQYAAWRCSLVSELIQDVATPPGVDIINLARLEPLYYKADGCEDKSVAGVKYLLGQAVIF